MQEMLIRFIEDLKVNKRIDSFDEASTKQAVILRLLNIVGWDAFNIDEVTPEYSVGGKRVDYSLRINNTNKVFIEVKKIGEELDGHQEQLLSYSFQQGVQLATLTNGITWWFYLPLNEGSWDQRKFYSIDVRQQNSDAVATKFIELLSRNNIENGQAIRHAKSLYDSQQKEKVLEDTLPKAWNKLISEPDGLLIDLISETTEKLCGYKAESEMVESFISKNRDQLQISPSPMYERTSIVPPRLKSNTPANHFGSYTGKSISAFSFRGAHYPVATWKELLMKLCEILYSVHSKEFNEVLSIRGSSRSYFTRDGQGQHAPCKIKNAGFYVETHFNANLIVQICRRMLTTFGYSKNDLKIDTR